ncbi:MAG: hypothetical protein ACTSSK_04930 [Candidatus Heimdallarchaeota archaeon]
MDEEAPIEIESLEEKQESKIKTRFKRLGEGFRTRLLKFTIVSLIGLGVNLVYAKRFDSNCLWNCCSNNIKLFTQ